MADILKQLPYELTALAKHLVKDNTGGEVFLVGGAVRDLLLGRATKDYDLVVRGVQVKALEAWLANHGPVSLVGKTFGVFKWQPRLWRGEAIDVALPRTEHVEVGTGQYRDFEVQSDPALPIVEDLSRRDFTVNALALNLTTGELVDPHHGEVDLTKRSLRTVGDPAARFSEDLSRTLRGIRFACALGFKLEPKTWVALRAHSARTATGLLKDGTWLVPREVVAREVLKAFIGNPRRALELLDDSGFLPELMPEVTATKGCPQPPEFHSEGNVFEHTKLALESLSGSAWNKFFGRTKPSLNVILAALLHDIGKPLTIKTPEGDGTDRIRTNEHDVVGAALVPRICERLKLTSYVDAEHGQVEPDVVEWLVAHHLLLVHGDPQAMRPATIYRYFLADRARGLAFQQLILADSASTLPVDGTDLTESLIRLQARIREVEQTLDHGTLKLFLSGDDIMKAFKLKPGPRVGKLLQELETAQLEGVVKTRRQALGFLKRQR